MGVTVITIIQYTALFLVLMIALPVHEFAHAFAAVKWGDDTPKLRGRYTLNPFAHFDILGFIMLMIVHFGWAKPVPINPYNFRDIKKGYFWTSIAGILTNITLAFVFTPVMLLVNKYVSFDFTILELLLKAFLLFFVMVNINLFAFNLIPVFPLDGFRILEVSVKRPNKAVDFLRTKGYLLLIGLIILHTLIDTIVGRIPSLYFLQYIDVFGLFMTYVSGGIYTGFTALWGLLI